MPPSNEEKAKLCYMDTDNVILYIKVDNSYNYIIEDVEIRIDFSNYELERPLPKQKNKKVINLMKDELGGKIVTEFARLRAKTYSYLIDNGSENKKVKGTKKCVVKLNFEDYKHRLEATQIKNKAKHLEKNNLNVDNFWENHKELKRKQEKKTTKDHNSDWLKILDYPYRIVIMVGSVPGKTIQYLI